MSSTYTVTVKYENWDKATVDTHNFPKTGISRMCNKGWHRFDPGYSSANAWTITDNTILETELLTTRRGTVEIDITSSHGCSATFSAEIAYMGGENDRIITVWNDDPISINGGEAGVLYENAEWDGGTPSLSLEIAITGVVWGDDDDPDYSDFDHRANGTEHTIAWKTISHDEPAIVMQGASASYSATARDQFGLSSASSSGDVCE